MKNIALYKVTELTRGRYLLEIKHAGTFYTQAKRFSDLEKLNAVVAELRKQGYKG